MRSRRTNSLEEIIYKALLFSTGNLSSNRKRTNNIACKKYLGTKDFDRRKSRISSWKKSWKVDFLSVLHVAEKVFLHNDNMNISTVCKMYACTQTAPQISLENHTTSTSIIQGQYSPASAPTMKLLAACSLHLFVINPISQGCQYSAAIIDFNHLGSVTNCLGKWQNSITKLQYHERLTPKLFYRQKRVKA